MTCEDVDRVVGQLTAAGMSASTRRGYVSALKGFFAFLAARKAAEIEACFGVRLADPVDEFNAARHVGADALRRCLDHHDRHHRGGNPHLLVSQKSKTTAEPVSASYLKKLLAPAGVTPTLLRVTRLAHLVTTLDPVIVAEAFGVRRAPCCTTSPTPWTPPGSPTREHQALPCIPSREPVRFCRSGGRAR